MEDKKAIGETIKPILLLLENTLWDYEAENTTKLPNIDDESFRAVVKIFMTAIVERIWLLQETENMDSQDRLNMVMQAGYDIKNLIKVYTDIDTTMLYDK